MDKTNKIGIQAFGNWIGEPRVFVSEIYQGKDLTFQALEQTLFKQKAGEELWDISFETILAVTWGDEDLYVGTDFRQAAEAYHQAGLKTPLKA